MKLYVVRHGQTDWNVNGKIQGQKDVELNSTGIAQANSIRDKFNKLDIDLIMCSPLKRAQKTAEIINQDRNLKIIYRDELIERGLGDFEGKDCETERDEIYNYYKNDKEMNIEPIVDLCGRINKLLDEIKENYSTNKIILVTHSGTARAIEAYFYGIDSERRITTRRFEKL